MKAQIPWLRVFVEGVVIVGSILLAFGIEAWWDGRQERAEIRQDLANVSQELAANRDLVRFQMDLMERMVSGSAALLEIMNSGSADDLVEAPDTLVFLAMQVMTLNASLGALDALIASGRLAAIEATDVRRRLAGLRSLVEDVREDQDQSQQLNDAHLMPLTYGDYDLEQVVATVSEPFWTADRIVGRGLMSQGSVDYPNSQAIRNFIRIRGLRYAATVVECRILLRELEELLVLIADPT